MESVATVLVIDDDYQTRKLIESALIKYAHSCSIDCAVDGQKGWDEFNPQQYDCVVSDLEMPEMSGLEFCRKVREQADTPFIIYTGKRPEVVSEAASEAGVNKVIRKGQMRIQDLANEVCACVETDAPRSEGDSDAPRVDNRQEREVGD